VRTPSSPLSAHLSAATIAPGACAQLELEVAQNTCDAEGAFTDGVFLYSNDPAHPLVKIGVRGVVFAPLLWQLRRSARCPVESP
jgi:hypothetical protein